MGTMFRLLLLAAMAAALLTPAVCADENEKLLGEGNDGNRSRPVHLIELYDHDGNRIRAKDAKPRPFSTKQTCGQCHNYDQIAQGWHFNAHDPQVDSGRPGQPWVLTDVKTRTQIPVTARHWPQTFAPEQVGLSPWDFVNTFFSHFPGGSYGQMPSADPAVAIRKQISGDYEINCLACHNASPQEDQSLAALQAARQNFRWIPTASSGLAVVNGVASSLDDFFDPEFDKGVEITWRTGLFDKDDMVFFDISSKPLDQRCYFCHSNIDLRIGQEAEFTRDDDVHLASGLHCVDCHRNGDDHRINRGYEAQGPGASLTCEGCHLGRDKTGAPEDGRLGAPRPRHAGIPVIHFEKLTCTACHSATWPEEQAGRWKTARIHRVGLHGKHNLDIRQPHIYAPVLMKGTDGKIGPYKLFWPAYWALFENDTVKPFAPKEVLQKARTILDKEVERVDDWRPLTPQEIAEVLALLSTDQKPAVYVAGGKLYRLNDAGELETVAHPAANPYAWPMAHDVRPARQAMGIRQCKDCHTTDSAFFFGKVQIDTPVQIEGGPEFAEMVQLQGINRLYMRVFNFAFVFRPMLKTVAFAACGLIGLVVVAWLLKAAAALTKAFGREED
ncbi:MAG TPA: hypothetical protein PK052_00880 [Anaerohalosphaeraceae bacterium]|nr:hypothetical protein [Phycisphaerae bacterium]HOK94828.1 hypothetical protein [Anaerohalosphaeraceae bacterium]HOL30510.1 hypothetical protein [Anaerohalosphaeraceae bacterium]HOM76220.1 hypothetical protein [Anaerohalosphaeraceae bacterium]HPC63956.1 hypothetical protein [Anaerohalosphaeraceae bacterium]